ncbi:prepilin-type N-terminal cleavage/methylation domain-containing protein, partial [Candidatus Desantisbacteria bacterium]|nr:prepilin-type N-terminal cleavage/methylation domain-containing protein [Candidatus Desantisbacteria bacterium]
KDWLVIGLFLSISIGFLIFYFYSINKINKKITNRHAASKGITLVEILVATVIVAISILCILKAIQQSSLVQPHTGESTMAITLCQEKLEEIRGRSYTSLVAEQQQPTMPERMNMPPYGWNGTTPINGGATRTVIIERIIESGTPTTPGTTTSAIYDYLKATVRMEWGTAPLRRELSVFIANRP